MSTFYRLLKRTFVSFCFLLLANIALAQTAADSLWEGFGHFRLGDPLSKFGDSMTLIKGQDTSNKTYLTFHYGYNGPKPVPVDSSLIKFKSFFVSFDRDDRLSAIYFVTFYGRKNKFPNYRQSKKDYRQLSDYFSKKLGWQGKKVIYYNKGDMLHEGYEWAYNNTVLIVDIQPNSKLRIASVGITLERKPVTASMR